MNRDKCDSRVYWVTGLSGAGKSTIGSKLTTLLRDKDIPVVHLDGDEMREIFGTKIGHSMADRKFLSMCYSRLCNTIVNQGISVVCSTVSMFDDTRAWNRQNIKDYREIYIRASIDVLVERDQKKLYSRALRGEIENVIGVNMAFEEPQSPDIVIDNDGNLPPSMIAEKLFNELQK